jgi:trans-aconitate methyltransferase
MSNPLNIQKDRFATKYDAHDHSLRILELISVYDDFMDSLSVVADMGCGAGLDITWFAKLVDRDPDEPRPYNYTCYAVDKDMSNFDKIEELPNLFTFKADFNKKVIPRPIDLLWCHDAFQYSLNPLHTLKVWNEQMSTNGMLMITIPQTTGYQYNRYCTRVHDNMFFEYNVSNLMYMLAVNGFDCKDSYFYKAANHPWIHAAVYKTDIAPMDPTKTRWYDLAEKGLLHPTVEASIQRFGYLRQEDIMLPWLDKQAYRVQD